MTAAGYAFTGQLGQRREHRLARQHRRPPTSTAFTAAIHEDLFVDATTPTAATA